MIFSLHQISEKFIAKNERLYLHVFYIINAFKIRCSKSWRNLTYISIISFHKIIKDSVISDEELSFIQKHGYIMAPFVFEHYYFVEHASICL